MRNKPLLIDLQKSALCGAVLLLLVASLTEGASLCDQKLIQKFVFIEAENYTFPEPSEHNVSLPPPTQRYENISACEMLFERDERLNTVRLAFGHVGLDPPEIAGDYSTCRDKIVLYDGNTTHAPILSTICGGRAPTIESNATFILLVFVRDPASIHSDRTFSLTYQGFLDVPSLCGRTPIILSAFSFPKSFNFLEGTAETYHHGYSWLRYKADFATCGILVKSLTYDSAAQVELAFRNVDLAPPETPGDYSTCRDKIVLYDGDTTSAPILSTICGGRIPTVESKSSSILVVLTKDSASSPSDIDFSLTFQAFRYIPSLCGQERIEETAFFGPLLSSFFYFPEDTYSEPYSASSLYRYEKNITTCEILIKPSTSSDRVQLDFKTVELDPPEIAGDYSTCRDKIVLYDGDSTTSPMLSTICGGRRPVIESDKNNILLVYTRGGASNHWDRGFSFSYRREELPISFPRTALWITFCVCAGAVVVVALGFFAYRKLRSSLHRPVNNVHLTYSNRTDCVTERRDEPTPA
ncbi:CUB and zona pellucida-like domain-containing protein 1 [Elysia marginata]|uniref:CUB and zona pellucida-like domain-containing protein 1 n=1 Tax=Elysia marginata TaxID=1093978 RepID=A0AAV4GJV8_9GAST|nr:CUB and zona pellucida-like domain-containing protein 1 [Elysia marginata]